MTIRIIGQSNDSGIGTHYYHYTHALEQIPGINNQLELINYADMPALLNAAAQSQSTDINISFVGAHLNNHFKGTNINWTVFESTKIPDNLLAVMLEHDLWIPSEWGKKIAVENNCDVKRIEVIPEGVDGNLFHPYLIPTQNKFRFLLIGKYENRKSVNESIEAFARVYGNNPSIELVIKSDFFRNPELKKLELENKIKSTGCNNIQLIWGYQTLEELINLYRSADVFLFPTRAEGWGLPLIEAAATGLPLITTFYSAQTEFLQDIRSSCVFVDYNLEPINCPEYQEFYYNERGEYGVWAAPTVDAIATSIEQAYVNYSALRSQAIKNSTIIRSKYSWANSAIKSLDALKKRGLI